MKYLRRFKPIIQKIAGKYGMEEKDMEEMVDHFFRTMKSYITDPRMPSIKITNFGTFKPTVGKLNKQIGISERHIKLGRVIEKSEAKIKHLTLIKERLDQEKAGMITWKEWRSKEVNIDYTKTGKNAKKQDSEKK